MNLDNSPIGQLIQGIGVMTELYTITYNSFKQQKLSDEEAIKHTKAFISVMMESLMNTGDKDTKEGGKT